MAKKIKKVEEEEDLGVDLSTAAEMWTEEELRQMMREEYLKLLLERQGQTVQPNTVQPQIYPTVYLTYPQQPYPQTPGWSQTTGGNINHLNDGHAVNCAAMSMA